MKHGDKAKGKAVKASGKKSGKSSSKVAQGVKAKKQSSAPVKASSKSASKASVAKVESSSNGKTRPGAGSDGVGFTNPLIASAFKRAVKKYPNAFRKLTD